MKSYSLKFIFFVLLNALGLGLWNAYGPSEWVNNHGWIALAVLSIISFGMSKSLQAEDNTEARFVRKFMAGTGIKMFVSLLLVLFYGIFNRPAVPGFILILMFHYIAFLVFEVATLMTFLKRKK